MTRRATKWSIASKVFEEDRDFRQGALPFLNSTWLFKSRGCTALQSPMLHLASLPSSSEPCTLLVFAHWQA